MKTRTNIFFYFFLFTFAFILCLLSFILVSCNTIEPPPDNGNNEPDTTTHNFSWQEFSFGDVGAGGSILWDVAIIDENNIWVVGEIYTADDNYNAVHWDGSEWELKKILYYGECSAVMYPPLKAIYAFSGEEIVLTNGGSIGRFDGNAVNLDCGVNPLLTGAINSIWGASSSDFYVVGNGGNIAHYNGNTWTKIESGTSADIKDIYGINESVSGKYKLLAVASSTGNTRILTINSNIAKDTLDWQINNRLVGIWLNDKATYVSGLGIWKNKDNEWEEVTKTERFYTKVKGSRSNNIFGVGSSSDGIIHYNGSSWKVIEEVPAGWNFLDLDVKNNLIVAVGAASSGGVIGDAVIFIGEQL